tara:strand:+ start:57 stop:176 length:120 start_codon:yes stop_codon:yes gene_type:complete
MLEIKNCFLITISEFNDKNYQNIDMDERVEVGLLLYSFI